MTQWYVKDLSKLTGVSVQTLHHYDRIKLLKPSLRLTNGYRVYSEKDLLKLQQIIALKYFGFELSKIKTLLFHESNALEHFDKQASVLERNGKAMLEGAVSLRKIIQAVKDDKSIPWQSIIEMIEVYRMSQNLDHDWVKEIFTPEELKEYALFEKELHEKSTPEKKSAFEDSWDQLLNEVKSHLKEDPYSEEGIRLGKKWMDWVNGVYGKKYASLSTKIYERGFKQGKFLDKVGMTAEIVSWVENATRAYWKQRVTDVLKNVGKLHNTEVLKQWNILLEEMYGEDNSLKQAIYEIVLKSKETTSEAKDWFKTMIFDQ